MKSIFRVFQHGLQRTKTSIFRHIRGLFDDVDNWNEESYERLESALISADLGVDVSLHIVQEIRTRYERGLIRTEDDILRVAHEDLVTVLTERQEPPLNLDAKPAVVLMVGVNGSGKTTTAAKLAHLWKSDGRSVLLAACDTFRAAGTEQLRLWADRVGCPVVAGSKGGDAAAVAYDAVASARQRGADIVLVDTAGRQHTRKDLMAELGKIRRTVDKACPGAPHEVFLTVDASTGTNALHQAREFGRLCDISGLILTKLDGTGKGGVVVAIRHELGHPIRFVGLGERMEDLQPFDVDMFVRAMFA